MDAFEDDIKEYLNSCIRDGWEVIQITSYNDNGVSRFNVHYVVRNNLGSLLNANAILDFHEVRYYKIKQRMKVINRIKQKIKNA